MNGNQILNLLFTLGFIALGIVSLIGLIYITKFAFSSTKTSDSKGTKYTVDMTETQLKMSQVTVVLSWIQIAMPVIVALIAMGYWMVNTNRSIQVQNPFLIS